MRNRITDSRTLALLLLFAAEAAAEAPLGRAEVEAIVKDYIMNNPQIVIDSVNALRQRQEKEALEAQRDAIKGNSTTLRNDKRDPAIGASESDADVTIVEFFDYNCGYCKQTTPELFKLIGDDKRVRVVMKEFPILGPDSVLAARYALAVHAVDAAAYARYHRALMEFRGQKTEKVLTEKLMEVGIDAAGVKKQLGNAVIDRQLQDIQTLAARLGITGTPGFVIGDVLHASAMNKDMLVQQIASIRQKGPEQGSIGHKPVEPDGQ